MTKTTKADKTSAAPAATLPTKHQQIVDLLSSKGGATLEEMSNLAGWLPHSTRAFMTGLRKKGYVMDSEKVEGVRRYRIASSPADQGVSNV